MLRAVQRVMGGAAASGVEPCWPIGSGRFPLAGKSNIV
jgi:hypothetical protein